MQKNVELPCSVNSHGRVSIFKRTKVIKNVICNVYDIKVVFAYYSNNPINIACNIFLVVLDVQIPIYATPTVKKVNSKKYAMDRVITAFLWQFNVKLFPFLDCKQM